MHFGDTEKVSLSIDRVKLDPSNKTLTDSQRSGLLANIQLLRDAIVLFTATGAARGVSGHTGEYTFISTYALGLLTSIAFILGGAFDTVPEVCILLALFESTNSFYPVVFDEAGMSQ